jgi:hypothetical protein
MIEPEMIRYTQKRKIRPGGTQRKDALRTGTI